ncbi:MAG: hypothetical protein HQ522_12880 [Bacteroidetes bacterium]|nr:hypothetical protein [Bacteroidota bacterium]
MNKLLFSVSVLLILISCTTQNKKDKDKLNSIKTATLEKLDLHPFILQLPNELNENSGIIFYKNLLWTFNDSGGENKIYGCNLSGEIKIEIEIKDAKNIDWEDIAQDKKYIYIGDFGNNSGARDNQIIYRINKKDISQKREQKVDSEEIQFDFKNQKIFDFPERNTPFDCEAMIELNGKLYIFTKDRSDLTTTIYQIPKKKGEYNIKPLEKFDIKGLITGADISPDKKKLALIGYNTYQPFLWLFSGFTSDKFFSGEKAFFELNSINNAQTEGICFLNNDSILISCERNLYFNEQVFLIGLKNIK